MTTAPKKAAQADKKQEVEAFAADVVKLAKTLEGMKTLRTRTLQEDGRNFQEVLDLVHYIDSGAYTIRDIYANVEAIVIPNANKRIRPGQKVSIVAGPELVIE